MRNSKHKMMLEIAYLMAEQGTCDRAQVGVVIANQGRIISTGYNGAPAGMAHCSKGNHSAIGLVEEGELIDSPKNRVGCSRAVHAEANAIAYAARFGLSVDGSYLYCTHCPCLHCAQLIIASGIKSVWYHQNYRDERGLKLLEESQVVLDPYSSIFAGKVNR